MTRDKAFKILNLKENSSVDLIKKRYHELMKQIHPDITSEHDYPYEVSEINAAYQYLNSHPLDNQTTIKNKNKYSRKSKESTTDSDSKTSWNAPKNPSAYCNRNIYHNVEDSDGIVIGQAIIDCGKYLWSMDEEFMLFLKSIYECSKLIVSESDDSTGRDRSRDVLLQAEIAYLLAQQFVDSNLLLNNSTLVGKISADTYIVDAMIEDIDLRHKFAEGECLVPGRLQKHRLYVNSQNGNELGYISFKDDRLYYVIIPLFERRAVKLKVQVANSEIKKQRGARYIDVSLMLKVIQEDKTIIADSINNKISRLLNQ